MSKKNISLILTELMKMKGVISVALVRRDGSVIESTSNTNIDMEAIGTMVATAVGTSEILASEFSHGDLEILLSEYTNGKILLAITVDDVLAIVADKTAVIGNIRYAVKMHMPDIIQEL